MPVRVRALVVVIVIVIGYIYIYISYIEKRVQNLRRLTTDYLFQL